MQIRYLLDIYFNALFSFTFLHYIIFYINKHLFLIQAQPYN